MKIIHPVPKFVCEKHSSSFVIAFEEVIIFMTINIWYIGFLGISLLNNENVIHGIRTKAVSDSK